MKRWIGFLMALAICVSGIANDGFPTPPEDASPAAEPAVGVVKDLPTRLDEIEARLAIVEKTKITAEEAREIAREEIGKVLVALQTSSGSVVTRAVSVSDSGRGGFELNPGEQLLGYTDVMTGQYCDARSYQPTYTQVRGTPVAVYDTPSIEFRSSGTQAAFQVKPGPLARLRARRVSSRACYVDPATGQRVCPAG